ncbi:hypothetical protein Tco_0398194 [Tanacetum coccineum]
MAALRYRDEHNKVGYLQKPKGSDDYHQVLDFLRASHIRSPELGPPAILATIDETLYTITEDLYVTEGKLTFYKNKFSPQWRFLVHTILHCLSTKSGSWDQFGSSLVVALIYLSDGRKFNFSSYVFKGMVSTIGNAKKFLMYPRFLQTILGIETSVARQYHVFKLSSKLFANMKLNFEGQPMPLLAAMLSQAASWSEGSGEAHKLSHHSYLKLFLRLGLNLTNLKTISEGNSFGKLSSKDTKKLFKDVEGKVGSRKVKAMEKVGEQDVDLDALRALANAAVIVDSNIPPGGTSSSYIPTDVPTGVALAEERLSEIEAVRLEALKRERSEKEKAEIARHDAIYAKHWKHEGGERKGGGEENQSTTILLYWIESMHIIDILDWMRQLIAEFEKIKMAVADLKSQELRRTLKRVGKALEPDTSKKQKSTEAPIPSVPDVPQPPVVSSPKSSGTRRKSLMADEAPILWSAFAGWEVISTPLGEINALYMMDQSTKHFTTLREILHMVDRQDLLKLYGLVVKYYENHPVAGAGLVLWGDLQVLMDSQAGGKGSLVLAKVGTVAYRLELLDQLSRVHSTFHVSNLKKCYADEPLAISLDEIQIDDKLNFIEEPVEIMDREVKQLKESRILIVKVRWNSRRKSCEKNYSSVRRYVADPVNVFPERSITKLILKEAVIFDVTKSKTTEDIISIGSFMEVLVLNHYVLVRKIL